MALSGKIHKLAAGSGTIHTGFFDCTLPPVLEIDSSDTVVLSTLTALEGRLRKETTMEEWLELRTGLDKETGPHTLTGPIFIRHAFPGDVLEVRIQELKTIGYGVNLHMPESSLSLQGRIRTFMIDQEKGMVLLSPGSSLPLRPFLGVMGVAPLPGERRSSRAPDYFGGNLDNKELIAGSTLYLPIVVEGALFSTGDAHACQGDGEVNGTALETAMEEAVLQFFLRKDLKLKGPLGETPDHWIPMAFHEDLDRAAEILLMDVIEFLAEKKGITRDEAYGLASLAVDFRITQLVNGNKGVHAMIPKRLFL
jgi:acetamidase/formamidase